MKAQCISSLTHPLPTFTDADAAEEIAKDPLAILDPAVFDVYYHLLRCVQRKLSRACKFCAFLPHPM